MDLKQAHAELRDIARELSNVPLPEALDLSGRVLSASLHLANLGPEDGEEEADPEKAATAYLDTEAEPFPKKRGWWLPPRNFGLNQALMGYNFWRFTILPLFPKKRAYNEQLQGIVIHPIWTPAADQLIRDFDLETAKKVVGLMRKSPTVQDDVRHELAWMEREFSIRIPEAIQAKILKDALTMAKRRWGVDRLRVKDQLIPLDGSAPRDL